MVNIREHRRQSYVYWGMHLLKWKGSCNLSQTKNPCSTLTTMATSDASCLISVQIHPHRAACRFMGMYIYMSDPVQGEIQRGSNFYWWYTTFNYTLPWCSPNNCTGVGTSGHSALRCRLMSSENSGNGGALKKCRRINFSTGASEDGGW